MATTSVESLQNKDTGKTWKEDFSNVKEGTKAYDDLLAKFRDFVAEHESFNKAQTAQFEDFLKSQKNISTSWDKINSEIEISTLRLETMSSTAEDIRKTFESIATEASSIGQRIATQRSVISQLSSLAGDISRTYSVEGQYQKKNLDRVVQRAGKLKDEFEFRAKILTGGSLELDALKQAQELNSQKTAELERQYNLKKLSGASRGELNEIQKHIDAYRIDAEFISEGNLLLVQRLDLIARINKETRRDVVRKSKGVQRIAGITGKIAGFLGLSDIQGILSDIYENFIQKAASNRSALRIAQDQRPGLENNVTVAKKDYTQAVSNAVAKDDSIKQKLYSYKALGHQIENRSVANQKAGISDETDEVLNNLIKQQNQLKDSDAVLGSIVTKMNAWKEAQSELESNSKQIAEAQKAVNSEAELSRKASSDMVKALADGFKFGNLLAVAIGAVAAGVWKSFNVVDTAAVKLQREIGTWEGGAAAANSELISSVNYLNQAYEISTKFHIDPAKVFTPVELAQAAEFQKMSNLSAQEVANLAVRSKSVGQSISTYNTTMKEGYNNILKNTDTAVAWGSVQKEIANTSEAISLSLGDNPKKLAEAATAALSLGMSMKEIEGVAENLMNFESSIEHEMEAQLLTGRQMNLAKAREYALNNDIAGLSEELRKNSVDEATFMHMSYFRQKSLAQALGMSRDQLAGMVRQRILGLQISDEEKARMANMSVEDVKRMTIQEQWQTSKEKFLQSLVPLLKPVLDTLTLIMGPIRKITGALGKAVSAIQPIINAVQSFFSKMQKWASDSDSGVKKVVGTVVTGGANMASSILMFSLVLGMAKKSLGGIGTAFKAIRAVFSSGFTVIRTVLSGMLGGIARVTGSLWKMVTASKAAATSSAGVGNMLKTSFSKLKTGAGNAWGQATGTVSQTVGTTKRGIGKFVRRSVSSFQDPEHSKAVLQRARNIKRVNPVSTGNVAAQVTGNASTVAKSGVPTGKGLGSVSKGMKSFSGSAVLKGAVAMVLVAGSLFILAKAMQQMQGIGKETFGRMAASLGVLSGAVAVMAVVGKFAGQALVGALAMGAIGVALIPLAIAMRIMEGVNWRTLGIMVVSIAAFITEFALIGALIVGSMGTVGVAVGIAVGMVASIGLALIPLATAARALEGIDISAVGTKVKSLFDNLKGVDVDLSSLRKAKRGVKQISKILNHMGNIPGGISLPSVSDVVNLFRNFENLDLSKVKIPGRIAQRLIAILAALSVISSKGIVSSIDILTTSLARFVEVLNRIDAEKFNSLSGKQIRAAVSANSSERVSENYDRTVNTRATVEAARSQQAAEVRVERTNLDVVLAKMEDIKKTIVASRPGWNWLVFGTEAAKNIPNWQVPV